MRPRHVKWFPNTGRWDMHGWRFVFISHGVLSGLRPLTAAKQTKRERRCMVLLIGIKLGDQFPAEQSCPHQRKVFKKKVAVCRLAFGVLWPTLFGDKPLIFHDESSRFIVCCGHDHWRYLFNMGYGSGSDVAKPTANPLCLRLISNNMCMTFFGTIVRLAYTILRYPTQCETPSTAS